jgi:hypothetical protein
MRALIETASSFQVECVVTDLAAPQQGGHRLRPRRNPGRLCSDLIGTLNAVLIAEGFEPLPADP